MVEDLYYEAMELLNSLHAERPADPVSASTLKLNIFFKTVSSA